MSAKPIRIMVIDDHQLIIDGIRFILLGEEEVLFAGGANNLNDALEFLSCNEIDVVLADISMPDHSGIEVTKKIKEIYPRIKVLALTMHEDIIMITKMLEAGASGYILKRTNMNEVFEAIKVVAEGGKYLGREVQAILMDYISATASEEELPEDAPAQLTVRELEVLNLIAREYSTDDIANKLFISPRTVETHRRNIFTKTKTKTIVGLIKYAIMNGMISQEAEG